eukprot:g108.t1
MDSSNHRHRVQIFMDNIEEIKSKSKIVKAVQEFLQLLFFLPRRVVLGITQKEKNGYHRTLLLPKLLNPIEASQALLHIFDTRETESGDEEDFNGWNTRAYVDEIPRCHLLLVLTSTPREPLDLQNRIDSFTSSKRFDEIYVAAVVEKADEKEDDKSRTAFAVMPSSTTTTTFLRATDVELYTIQREWLKLLSPCTSMTLQLSDKVFIQIEARQNLIGGESSRMLECGGNESIVFGTAGTPTLRVKATLKLDTLDISLVFGTSQTVRNGQRSFGDYRQFKQNAKRFQYLCKRLRDDETGLLVEFLNRDTSLMEYFVLVSDADQHVGSELTLLRLASAEMCLDLLDDRYVAGSSTTTTSTTDDAEALHSEVVNCLLAVPREIYNPLEHFAGLHNNSASSFWSKYKARRAKQRRNRSKKNGRKPPLSSSSTTAATSGGRPHFETMTCDELRAVLRKHGLRTGGRKKELLQRIPLKLVPSQSTAVSTRKGGRPQPDGDASTARESKWTPKTLRA